MAITVHQDPEIMQAAYNDLTHVVSSSNYLQTNFKYIFDIYVNGGATKIHREAIPPHPTYGNAVFNPARILESYVTRDFDLSQTASYTHPNSIATYIIKFGEEYGLSSSGTTVYPNMVTSTKKFIWNSVFDFEDYVGISWSSYRSGSSSKKFLTNAPNYKKVYIDSNYSSGNEFIAAINDSSGSIYFLFVETYDINGSTVGEYYIENNYQAISSDTHKIVGFPIGYNSSVIPIADIVVGVGALPILSSTVVTYRVSGVTWAGAQRTEHKYFTIERSCSRYPLYEIYFLNKLGGYDTFYFNLKSNWKEDIKRESFKSNQGTLTSTSFTYAAKDRATTNYSINIEDTITLRSDYINDATMEWLEELVTSPDAYMYRDGEQVPINITNSSFERKQQANERLFTLTIDVKFSYKRNRQRF